MRKRLLASLLAVLLAVLAIAPGLAEEGRTPFTVLTVRWTDAWPVDFLKQGIMKQLEDQAHVDITWDVRYNADWSEQKSLLLASPDVLPDVLLGSICLNAADISQNASYFVDLTPYITPEIMPNLCAAMEKEPALRAVCTSRDGKIYSLPKKLPLRPKVCGYDMYVNKDYLAALGMEVPTNLDELYAYLVACGTKDPDGDGDPSNNFGLTGSASSYKMSDDCRYILRNFGTMVSRDNNYMGLDKDGKLTFVPVTENYKQAVKWMAGLWKDGAIDPEYFTQDGSAVTSKYQNPAGAQVGALFSWSQDSEVGLNAKQFAVTEAIEGYDGTHYVEAATYFLDLADRELLITTKCQNVEAVLRWADGFYTDMASLQTFYGSIPDQIADNGDGTYTVTVPGDGSSLDTSAWSNSLRDFGPKYMTPDFYGKVILPEDQGDGIKLGQDKLNAKYVTLDKNVGMPMVQYTEDELRELTAMNLDISSFVEQKYANWVTGVEDIDEGWDAYLQQLKDMQLDRYVEIQQQAYAVYLENMK